MENYELAYDQDIFDNVWQRVMSQNTEAVPAALMIGHETDDAAQLRELMDDEAADYRYYMALSRRCSAKETKPVFLRIAEDERRHLRKLQAAYFIMTGDTYIPAMTYPEIPSCLEALRIRYIGETRGAQAYLAAAAATKYEKLAYIYHDFAQDESRHAVMMEELIEKAMK